MKKCDNCNRPEADQALVKNGQENWCLDCMRINGLCISCACDIRPKVEDYFNYDDDECPECTSIKMNRLKHSHTPDQ